VSRFLAVGACGVLGVAWAWNHALAGDLGVATVGSAKALAGLLAGVGVACLGGMAAARLGSVR